MNLRVIDQVQFGFSLAGIPATIKSFTIKAATEQCKSFSAVQDRLLESIQAVMALRVENDALNKLVIMTAMDWQACDALRTYRNYYLQLEHRTTKDSIHHALINNPHVAKALYDYFEARFRPDPDLSLIHISQGIVR